MKSLTLLLPLPACLSDKLKDKNRCHHFHGHYMGPKSDLCRSHMEIWVQSALHVGMLAGMVNPQIPPNRPNDIFGFLSASHSDTLNVAHFYHCHARS